MTNPTLQSAQRFLDRHGLIPRTRLARFCLVLAIDSGALDAGGLAPVQDRLPRPAADSSGCLLVLGYRAFAQRFMWRLRNRLIVTYVFIGVIPLVLLATMGMVAGYLFAGQFSTFVVTTDVHDELRRLESSNRTITHQAAAAMRRSGTIDPGSDCHQQRGLSRPPGDGVLPRPRPRPCRRGLPEQSWRRHQHDSRSRADCGRRRPLSARRQPRPAWR